MAKTSRYLYPHEAQTLGFDIKENEKGRNTARYQVKESDWETVTLARMQPNPREFVETQIKKDKDGQVISTVEKLQSEPIEVPEGFEIAKVSTSKSTGQQWIQYLPKKEEKEIEEIDFDSIIKKYIKPFKVHPISKDTGSFSFDRLVYTDVHIGMTPNQNGFSLYGGKWDEEEIQLRLDVMINKVLSEKKSNVLIIDELGDFLDGWDSETVRKGHKLPQNMDNEKAFDVGLEFKIRLVDSLAPYYSKIICNNICNDNHAGSFGYTVNKASKRFLEYRYKHVKVFNHRTFIVHYVYGNNCFILTHGKDGKNLKFGFKPILDAKQIEKIEGYIDHHDLHKYDIEFSKGDSHQKIFDESTSDKFNYFNYGAFSPSSEWVQTNFKKGKSFFEFFNYKEDGSKTIHPHVFKWDINRKEETIILSA